MKRFSFSIFLMIFVFSGFSVSCKFGVQQAFYRKNQVNERSREIKNFSGTPDDPFATTDINSGKFSVVVITDIHFGRLAAEKKERFRTWLESKKAEAAASGHPVKFAVCLGDISETGGRNQMQDYVSYCNDVFSGIRVYTVAGNHDLYNDGWNHFSKVVYPYCSSYMFRTSYGGKDLSWYFLDTANGTLGRPQLDDLLKKLKSDPNPKIVSTHYPIYAGGRQIFTLQNQNERDLLISVFLKNNVKLLLGGHWHVHEDYSYGNYFKEYNFGSFVDHSEASVIKVDLNSMDIDVQYMRF